jgi:hypothetical protein
MVKKLRRLFGTLRREVSELALILSSRSPATSEAG